MISKARSVGAGRRQARLKLNATIRLLLAIACLSGTAQAQVKAETPVSQELLDLLVDFNEYVESGRPIVDYVPADSALHVNGGFVLVDATSKESGQQLLAELDTLGLMNGAAFGRLVSGWLPIRSIEALQDLVYLKFVRAAAMSTGTASPKPPRKTPCQ